MATLFISDLHLDESRPEATDAFIHFLQTDARSADALYILGDLFEAWIGDDHSDPHNRRVIRALAELTATGIPCFIMRGNRDFLIGQGFCATAGVKLLADPTLAWVHDTSVLLSHGDFMCTDDLGYMRYRKVIRHPAAESFLNGLPFSLRNAITRYIRANSAARVGLKPPEITGVNQAAVESVLREYGVNTLLHGHTHRPDIHRFNLDGSEAMRIVLGDWYEQGSVLSWDENGPRLASFSY
ncbi:MAG: UDP-2,3-diacylglucosamine diphosphatase [Chromatiales bacterium]|nr:UDP-2,3-diacylglucosamine diphosphatase [Chromatiales bacterium]